MHSTLNSPTWRGIKRYRSETPHVILQFLACTPEQGCAVRHRRALWGQYALCGRGAAAPRRMRNSLGIREKKGMHAEGHSQRVRSLRHVA